MAVRSVSKGLVGGDVFPRSLLKVGRSSNTLQVGGSSVGAMFYQL